MTNSRRLAAWVVLAAPMMAAAAGAALTAPEPVPPIGGVHEIAIGCTDLAPLIEYWSRFGYRPGAEGRLDAARAGALYGVDSALRSVRLLHQDADHGLLRLMAWERPRNSGLQTASMRAIGNRWGAMLTADVYAIANHAEDAVAAGLPIRYVEPQRQVIYATGARGRPFLDPVTGVRELLLIQPLTRQVMFQRYGYALPLYGRIDESSPFRSSQVTHAGMVIQGGPESLRFYDEALGLLRVRDGHESTYAELASRHVFELGMDERYVTTDFDDPRSSGTDPSQSRSGRLKVIRFVSATPLPDLRELSRPGSLGYSMYSFRVRDLDEHRRRVLAGGATDVTLIQTNEFGERSLTFAAPDGYVWALVEAR
jgi:catechol 2,3-dioxygenase-like lactoylglutathione lyase family enzyme